MTVTAPETAISEYVARAHAEMTEQIEEHVRTNLRKVPWWLWGRVQLEYPPFTTDDLLQGRRYQWYALPALRIRPSNEVPKSEQWRTILKVWRALAVEKLT